MDSNLLPPKSCGPANSNVMSLKTFTVSDFVEANPELACVNLLMLDRLSMPDKIIPL
jgi:hypothetical protein